MFFAGKFHLAAHLRGRTPLHGDRPSETLRCTTRPAGVPHWQSRRRRARLPAHGKLHRLHHRSAHTRSRSPRQFIRTRKLARDAQRPSRGMLPREPRLPRRRDSRCRRPHASIFILAAHAHSRAEDRSWRPAARLERRLPRHPKNSSRSPLLHREGSPH